MYWAGADSFIFWQVLMGVDQRSYPSNADAVHQLYAGEEAGLLHEQQLELGGGQVDRLPLCVTV